MNAVTLFGVFAVGFMMPAAPENRWVAGPKAHRRPLYHDLKQS